MQPRASCLVQAQIDSRREGPNTMPKLKPVVGSKALLGKAVEFERGRATVRSFGDYPVIRMREAPAIEVHVVPSSLRPFGLGEPPVPAAGAAVLNAIFAATGKRIRQTPIRREELAT